MLFTSLSILWALLLVLALIVAWALNLLGIPGNWILLLIAAAYGYLMPDDARLDIGWTVIIALAGLAALGELIELLASAIGVRTTGGSRRGAVLAFLASITGALIGAVVGLPIPYIGPVIGAVFFAGIGALAGAIAGERWAGRPLKESWKIGLAAFMGRLLGTAGKMFVGAAMIALVIGALLV